MALFAVLFFLLPVLSVEAIFQADMDWDSPELVSAVLEELDMESLGFFGNLQQHSHPTAKPQKRGGLRFRGIPQAQALYWLALSPYAEEDDFVQKIGGLLRSRTNQ